MYVCVYSIYIYVYKYSLVVVTCIRIYSDALYLKSWLNLAHLRAHFLFLYYQVKQSSLSDLTQQCRRD